MTTSTPKRRIGVIFGGRSGEHAVSLVSARSIMNALDPEKYTPVEIGITREGLWLAGENVLASMARGETGRLSQATLLPDPTGGGLYRVEPSAHGAVLELLASLDVVFPVLHGTFGEDGTLQGLLEMADLAYVGAGVAGSAVGMDKGIFKDVMRANRIPVLEAIVVLRSEITADPEGVIRRAEAIVPYPLFTKPANLGSSVGVTKCRTRSDLLEGLLEAAQYDRRVLVERGLAQAREIEVSVLGNDQPEASVPGEVVPAADFYTYEAKYHDDRSVLHIPAPVSPEVAAQTRTWAVRAYRAIDAAGMARVDFLLDKQSGGLYLNEINTIPGFTQISMYPKLWEASGLPYPALVDQLIELALERKAARDATVRDYTPGHAR